MSLSTDTDGLLQAAPATQTQETGHSRKDSKRLVFKAKKVFLAAVPTGGHARKAMCWALEARVKIE